MTLQIYGVHLTASIFSQPSLREQSPKQSIHNFRIASEQLNKHEDAKARRNC